MKKYLIGVLVGIFVGVSSVVLAAAVKNFPDVSKSAYYYNALQEMVARDVIKGYDNGKFGPNDPVTRGQLVKILSNYDWSLTTYKGEHNDVGDMMDIICAKIQVTDADEDIQSKFEGLCIRRAEAGADF